MRSEIEIDVGSDQEFSYLKKKIVKCKMPRYRYEIYIFVNIVVPLFVVNAKMMFSLNVFFFSCKCAYSFLR